MNCPQVKNETLTGAELMIRSLVQENVTHLFGYPGGAIIPFYDALVGSPLTHILTRHEQGAVFAADGYARSTGRVGVCVATSGPGATNLVTGIANAYLDSIPMVLITGQVNRAAIGTDAFQEVDTIGITMPVVKHSFLVQKASDIPQIMGQAFELAQSGRPGPVLIDVPKDTQLEPVPYFQWATKKSSGGDPDSEPVSYTEAIQLLEASERPVIYGGGGIVLGNAVDAFRDLIQRLQVPVVTTLKAMGAIPRSYPYDLGMLGMHGQKEANHAVQESDLLVCVGARFDDRVTGLLSAFAPNAKVIHMDIDPAEVGKRRVVDVALMGQLNVTLKGLLKCLSQPLKVQPWRDRWVSHDLSQQKTTLFEVDTQTGPQEEKETSMAVSPQRRIDAPQFLRALSDTTDAGTIVTCDVGQHQMWVALHYRFDHPREHLSSSGLGAMGYGLPAAVGAQLGCPDARVINISGDGSVMMNIQEMATLLRYQLPVKIVVMDNQRLGMVRQWQDLFNDGRESEVDLSDNPDFVKVAQAFGLDAFRITHAHEIPEAVRRLRDDTGPLLVHVCLAPEENLWPFVPPGRSNSDVCENEEDVHFNRVAP
jgi:acetolactate synthase I/II/III large subunit